MHVHVHIGTVADCVFKSNLRQRTKKIRISVWIPLPLHLQSSCDSITLTFFDISVYILHKSDEHISQFARPMPREQTRRKHSHTLIHAQYTYLTAYIQSSAKKKKKSRNNSLVLNVPKCSIFQPVFLTEMCDNSEGNTKKKKQNSRLRRETVRTLRRYRIGRS